MRPGAVEARLGLGAVCGNVSILLAAETLRDVVRLDLRLSLKIFEKDDELGGSNAGWIVAAHERELNRS